MRWLIAAALAPVVLLGQPRPEFEVASIHPVDQTLESAKVGIQIDGSMLRLTYLSLKDMIRMAEDVKDYQVVGPEWITGARFDIAAKFPAGATREQVRPMLQTLLSERFHLKTHHDSKEFPVYALLVGKGGPKMKPAPLDADAAAGPVNITATGSREGTTMTLGNGATLVFANNKFEARKLSMLYFTDLLGRYMDRPVVDQTGLTGTYDFTLEVTPEDYIAMLVRAGISAGAQMPPEAVMALQRGSGESLYSALELVGLKLEPRKAPLPVVVVDQVEKSPTAN
jgi:uncharacterized protein (TIGR03435 family)